MAYPEPLDKVGDIPDDVRVAPPPLHTRMFFFSISRAMTRQYWLGFALNLGAALLYGPYLALVELVYKRAGSAAVTYALVIETQMVMGLAATALCTVGMIVNNDFQAIPREARQFKLGETWYYTVLVSSAVLWQVCSPGIVGVVFGVHTGILLAVFIPMTQVAAVIFLHEKFSSEKGVSLVLALWGLASYSYGEWSEAKAKKKEETIAAAAHAW